MQSRFPIYIISKGRWESRLTVKALDLMSVSYRVVVESQEYNHYAAVIDPSKLLILDPAFQRDYDPLAETPGVTSKGSGPARNFVWTHAISEGHERHWILDDNIRSFMRLHANRKIRVYDGAIFAAMEDFVLRYENVALAGPNYDEFAKRKQAVNPVILNTRLYSCILIRNDVPFRWRGRYNEDTILSLDLLKAGWCTVQFNAFLQDKGPTRKMKGGNTDELYRDGTLEKSRMLVNAHPDVSRLVWKFNRWHHHVDYRPFKANRLKLKPGIDLASLPKVDNYGMQLVRLDEHSMSGESPHVRQ